MDKCPFCGAGISREGDVWILFMCGSERNKREDVNWQGTRCKDRQIAALTSDLEAANNLLKGYEAELADYAVTVIKLRNELVECKEKLELDSLDFKGGVEGE